MCSVCAATAGGSRDYPSETGRTRKLCGRYDPGYSESEGCVEGSGGEQREEKETGRYIDQLNKKIFDGHPCGNNCIYNL